MLETVCRDKGKTEGNLYSRLDALAKEGSIPATLAEVAHQLRVLRNFGAHDDEVDVVAAIVSP